MNKFFFYLFVGILSGQQFAGAMDISEAAARGDMWKAAKKGDLKSLKYCLKWCPRRVNKRDFEGLAPLHHAVSSGQEMAARMLLADGADANLEDIDGKTPLQEALLLTGLNKEAIVRALLEHGADANRKSYEERLPIHIAAAKNDAMSVCLLHKYTIDENQKDLYGLTPLDIAQMHGHVYISQLLRDWQNWKRVKLSLCATMHPRLGKHSPANNLSQPIIKEIVGYLKEKDYMTPVVPYTVPKPPLFERMVVGVLDLAEMRRVRIGAAVTVVACAGFTAWRLLRRFW